MRGPLRGSAARHLRGRVPGGGPEPRASSSSPRPLRSHAGARYFAADDGLNGFEVWKTDGTPAGTGLVHDINTGPGDAFYWTAYGRAHDGTRFIGADDGVSGSERWRLSQLACP